MKKLHIITRCSRPGNLPRIAESIPLDRNIQWHVIFDSTRVQSVDTELLRLLYDRNTKIYFESSDKGDYLYPQMSKIIKNNIPVSINDWVYCLDDDNILHVDLIDEFSRIENKYSVIVFNQFVDGKDFTGLNIRLAKPENTKVKHIDLAQFIVRRDIFSTIDFKEGYDADGKFIERVYARERDNFIFIDKILCHYNYLQKSGKANVPRILYIGKNKPVLKTNNIASYESNELDVTYISDDSNIFEDIARIKPLAIVSTYKNPTVLTKLWNAPFEFRRIWINLDEDDVNIGEKAYQCAMASMLDYDNSKLISYFTPAYNTGEKILVTYNSLVNQTYIDWEWIIVDDSTDNGFTNKILNNIASKDPRVKVYKISPNSMGNIGEVKWRAASLCRGYILAELDHDDFLVPTCTEDLYRASQVHEDAGFFYTDSAEIDENWNSLTYGDGFAFGYGTYKTENLFGRDFQVAVSSNINPKTIRHIVGVPNHVRAWRREIYFEIGGHCRDLVIADDYELIVRTFLKTKMVRIPRLGYLQFIYNSNGITNSHNLARADIQRRVKTIMLKYNEDIKRRFEEFGLIDWAYDESPNNPWLAKSRFGEKECSVNEIYKLNI